MKNNNNKNADGEMYLEDKEETKDISLSFTCIYVLYKSDIKLWWIEHKLYW